MHTTRYRILAGLVLMAMAMFCGQAFAATVAVGSCTSLVNFATIQQAVNAVPPGSTIRVCPGTYHEQVSINEKLTISGVVNSTLDAAVIVPPTTGLAANTADVDNPALPIAAQVWVHDTDGPVLISNITVDGSNNQVSGCAPDVQGILFQNASGTLNHVAVRNQTLGTGLGGCQSGEGIYIQSASGATSTVIVENSSVHNYNKNGITANDTGTKLTATGNYVQGSGVVPSGGAAQNGIQLGFGATGKISSNTVIDNIYGNTTLGSSADILLFDTADDSAITVSSNIVGNSQFPIGLFTDFSTPGQNGAGVSVTSNKVFGASTFDGIDVCTNGNTITTNTIFNSAESGVHLDSSCSGGGFTSGENNKATGNTIVESSCAGVLIDTLTGNTTSPNTYATVPFTTTSSTSKCTIPAGPMSAAVVRSVTGHPGAKQKFSPAR